MELSDDNYSKLLPKAAKPVLLFFHAEFCGPSALMDAVLAEVEDKYINSLIVASVDVEKLPQLTKVMQVKGTPSFIFINRGEPIGAMIGTMSALNLQQFIDRMFGLINKEAK